MSNSKFRNIIKMFVVCSSMTALCVVSILNTSNLCSAADIITSGYLGFAPDINQPPRGIDGSIHIYQHTIKTNTAKIIIIDSVYKIVKPDGKGGFETTHPDSIAGDIKWSEITAETLPLPNVKGKNGILKKLPVYKGNKFVGNIVNTEFYSAYPKSVAYFVATSQIDTIQLTCNLLTKNDKVLLSPKSPSGDATVQLTPEYINLCNIQSVTYKLVDSQIILVKAFTPSHTDEVVTIPATYFIPTEKYYIMCSVVKDTGTEVITIPISR